MKNIVFSIFVFTALCWITGGKSFITIEGKDKK